MFPQAAANPGRASMLIAGDDAGAKETVSALARDLGFEPVDAGGLEAARGVEAFADLNIAIAYRMGRGPFAYRLAEAKDL
jgi:8-hydroxy-5-deazaflavin:NADPH oxidoreductase